MAARLEGPARVVGGGGSAGVLEPFSELLAHLPSGSDLCAIVVLHLPPDHHSLVAELLSRPSAMAVTEAVEGQALERDHVYVIPPGRLLEVRDGALHMEPRPTGPVSLPIDHLLRSLAEQCGSRGAGVVLSGTGSDGADGLREVKAAGGLAIAQDPETAAFDGMPRAAIRTGAVDLVLPPAEIARELVSSLEPPPLEDAEVERSSGAMARIFQLLRNGSGIDFSLYRKPTIRRRLQRRMMIRKAGSLPDYAAFLQGDAEEVRLLADDILIQVTRFFRDPDSFELLAREVFPRILEEKPADEPLRVWVPACATGEEAYSAAITLLDVYQDRASAPPFQLFATDVSETAVARARAGSYAETIAGDVPSARLRRYFIRADGGYRVSPAVREHCVFAQHDVTRDPPFSRLDLVVCRNLLIYLEPSLQRTVIRLFHYALNPDAFLLLGEAETIGAESNLFRVADKKHKLYRKKAVATPVGFDAGTARRFPAGRVQARPVADPVDVSKEAQRILLERHVRPAVLVDAELQIVESFGETSRFLRLSPGRASLSLLKMARPGLGMALRRALTQSRRDGAPVHREGLRVRTQAGDRHTDVSVAPLQGPAGSAPLFLVVFHEEEPDLAGAAAAPGGGQEPESARVRGLELELESIRGSSQSVIHDLEAANEELQSANEEILSSNEELQSTNEELETAREELQSTNEEVGTVNEELGRRNEELLRLNSDLENLLHNVEIAVVIVSQDLRIRRFTTLAEGLLNLIPSDLGRPISQIRPGVEIPGLEAHIREVIDKVTPFEREVAASDGRWLSLRIRPYEDADHRIDGAVLCLMDVSQLKQHELTARRAQLLADTMLDAVRDSLLVLDGGLRVQRVNRVFREVFRVTQEETVGRPLWELGNGQWDVPELRRLLEELLPHGRSIDDFRVAHEFPHIGLRRMRINARRIEAEAGDPLILLAIHEDVAAVTKGPA